MMKERIYLLLIAICLPTYGIKDDEQNLLKTVLVSDKNKEHLDWLLKFIGEDISKAYQRSLKYLYDNMNYLNQQTLLKMLDEAVQFHKKKGFISELEFFTIIEVAKIWKLEPLFIQEYKKTK